MSEERQIRIQGARVHNLRNINLKLAREQLVVLTGVSGSGKSSLAFDTLFAEGYRKFMDSLSTRARQVMEQLERPDVDRIEGLTPVIAIEQRTGAGANPRSTVATLTEIADYARLLWSLCGVAYCPKDGGRIVRFSLDETVDRLLADAAGARLILLAPYMQAKRSVLRGELPHLKQKGFLRVRIDGVIGELEDPDLLPAGRGEMQMDLVVDRIVLKADQRSRLADSLELAFAEGGERALALIQKEREGPWQEQRLSQGLACECCGETYPALSAKQFSWDHPMGACSRCGGLGQVLSFSRELLIPDPQKSVRGGAIKPWRLGSKRMIIQRNAILKQLSEQVPFDGKAPWAELSEDIRDLILLGGGDREFLFKTKPGRSQPEALPFAGVIADLEESFRTSRSEGFRNRLMTYQVRSECPECRGTRLNATTRAVLLSGWSFDRFLGCSLEAAARFVDDLDLPGFEEAVGGLRSRLHFLNEVGLGYLALDRAYTSLSGGEAQRVRLATQVGMGLSGVTYVLDEPTVGLHPANTVDLLATLRELREAGNSVIVVEHDPEIIRAADQLVELGPGAGPAGGEIVFNGTIAAAKKSRKSRTGAYLSGRAEVSRAEPVREPGTEWLRIEGASEHNLKAIDAAFPVGLISVVTGVSGSGKSTLVNEVLGKAAAFKLNRAKEVAGRHQGLHGLESFSRVVRVDQSSIGRSPRSNPATYTKIFDDLRSLYARTPLAKVRGYRPGRFSFNVRGGRCEKCQGDGLIRMEMHFLSDVYSECPSCQGQRYNRETLEVRFKGASIADVLNMSVDEAYALFAHQPKLRAKLATLREVGLGYLQLGQAAPTLSGGEAQRLKLSLELSKGRKDRCLYLLDEPTTGLHWDDVQHLMDLLFKLRGQGHTLILIEHNTDVIRLADWIIDLGPGGGSAGGSLLYAGPLQGLPEVKESHTARFL
jgi:excinuclease ABC subunit A